jgi:photosystem II stability/assembly factor-like uncharacterized protein
MNVYEKTSIEINLKIKMKNIFSLIMLTAIFICADDLSAQWQQTNGPRGGLTSCYASDTDEIYVGTHHGGVFRSINNGASWAACNNGLTALNITALCADNEKVYMCNGTNGFYRSIDDGQSWQTFPSFWSSYQMGCVAAQGDHIFVGTWGSGFMVSNDGGNSWNNAMSGIVPSTVGYMAPYVQIVDDVVYCIVNAKLYSSVDYALNWSLMEDGFPSNTSIYQIQTVGSNLFATTSAGLFTTNTNVINWIDVTDNLPIPFSFPMTSDGNLLYITGIYGEGVFYTSDYGLTWTEMNTNWQNTVASIYGLGEGKFMVQTSFTSADFLSNEREALYFTENNGSTWENVTNEITSTICLSFTVLGDKLLTGSSSSGIFSSSDEGGTWSHLGVNNINVSTMYSVGNTALVGGEFGIKRSTDNGESWLYASSGLYNISTRGFTHIDENIFTANVDGVYISVDDGQNWSPQNNGLTSLNTLSLLAMNDTLYAGTVNGVFVSTNYGGSWESVSNGLPPNAAVTCIKSIGSTLFIIVSGNLDAGIYASQDHGANWYNVHTNQLFSTLEVVQNMLFAGTRFEWDISQVGVKVSHDLGATWLDANEGLSNNMVYDLEVSGDYIYASTLGSGVYKRPLTDFMPENISKETRANISIFPNPANDRITINVPSHLIGNDAVITNELGQQIKVISKITANNIQVDCSAFATGFYVVQIGEERVRLVVQ